MLIGNRYKLTTPVRAIENVEEGLVSITIPAGGIVEVVALPNDPSDTMVDVVLEGRSIVMHAFDVKVHATEISD